MNRNLFCKWWRILIFFTVCWSGLVWQSQMKVCVLIINIITTGLCCCLAVNLWYVWKGRMITSVWSGICCAGAKLLSHLHICRLQMINAQPQAKINTLKYHHIATIMPHTSLNPHMLTSFNEQCFGPLRSPQCLSGFAFCVLIKSKISYSSDVSPL